MGLMTSALQIGRSALLSYQSALQVVGANISSAGNPDYTRLLPELDSIPGSPLANGLQPGAGVTLNGIQRTIDESLEGRLRLAIGEEESIAAQQSSLSQVESFFDDTSGGGVAARLQGFFDNFSNLQNTPEDLAVRDLVVQAGIQTAGALQGLRQQLVRLGEDIDTQITTLVETADGLASEIADLNSRITAAEAGGRGQATALRDQRDSRLRRLSELFDVVTREQPDGSLNVYVGSEALVQGGHSRGLSVATRIVDGFQRTSVLFADTGSQIGIRTGRLQGLIESRDNHVFAQTQRIDRLAAALIADVNRYHADGQGLNPLTDLTGAYDVLSPDAVLNSSAAGLTNTPRNGSFFITVSDNATNTPVAYEINVTLNGSTGDTTLNSLVADINASTRGVTASITSDNRLALTANDGFTFTLGNDGEIPRQDTSGLLAALGVNNFFSGTDASDIEVNDALIEDPTLIAAATSFLPGDGSNALRIAALATTASPELGGVSLQDFHIAQLGSIASATGAANTDFEAANSVTLALNAQRESISGVNLDEEAISLLKFQRAYQGATRFVSVVDQLTDELIALIR